MNMKNFPIKELSVFLIFGFIILGVLIGILGPVIQYTHKNTFEGTITEKYNKRDGDTDKFYVVLNDDQVIQNSDLLFKGKFNSADIQAKLKKGDKVKIETIGYRIPILNMYPILYNVKED